MNALGFGADCIKIVVSMATDSSQLDHAPGRQYLP